MNNKKGFTLVELLAVVMILGLLIVITSTTVLQLLKTTTNNLKQKQFNSLLEAGETYINDVVEKNNTIQPQVSSGSTKTYTGYALLEYVGTCNQAAKYAKYCWSESTNKNIITRVIYFDSYALKDYIDLDKYNIDYSDKDNLINACKLKAEITVELNDKGYYLLDNIKVEARTGVTAKRCVK